MLIQPYDAAKSMRRRLRFLRQAESDVAEILSYLANENLVLARTFRTALQTTGALLLDMPHIGSMRVTRRLALKNIRLVPIRDFEKYVVFYRSLNDGIEIVRVLHGARDYPALF